MNKQFYDYKIPIIFVFKYKFCEIYRYNNFVIAQSKIKILYQLEKMLGVNKKKVV